MAPWNHETFHIPEFDRSDKITNFRTSYDLVHARLISMDMRREFDREWKKRRIHCIEFMGVEGVEGGKGVGSGSRKRTKPLGHVERPTDPMQNAA